MCGLLTIAMPMAAVYAATTNDACSSTTATPQAQKTYNDAYTAYMNGLQPTAPSSPIIYNPMPAACNPMGSVPCDLSATLCYCKALFKDLYGPVPYQPWMLPADSTTTPPRPAQPYYAFAGPVVQCFTNMDTVSVDNIRKVEPAYKAQLGIIPAVTINFMKAADHYYVPMVKAILTVVVMLFGIRLAAGHVKEIKKDTYMLFFKVAGVFLFFAWAPRLYQWIIYSIQGLSYLMSQANAGIEGSGFCIGGGSVGSSAIAADSGTYMGSNLWGVWDCIFGYLLIAAGTVGMGAFILLSFKTPGIGMIVACIAFYMIISLFFAVARSVHYFLMGVLGFSFMYCMGFLFVPLVMFNNSMVAQYFKKWLLICIAFILSPLILLGFMGTMLVALDVATLSGQYSIVRQMAPGTFGQNLTKDGNTGINNPLNNPIFLLSQKQANMMTDDFKGAFNIVLDSAKDSTGSNKCGTAPTTPASPTTSTSPTTAVQPLYASQGVMGNAVNTNIKASCDSALIHPNESAVGFLTKVLDVQQLIQFGSNSTAAISANDMKTKISNWKVNEFLAFATAALIAYILYALVAYVPDLAADLVSQGTTSAQALARSKFIGEEQIMGKIEETRGKLMSKPDSSLVSGR